MTREPIPPFQVALSWDRVVVTVTVTGEVDCVTAPGLARRLLDVAAAHPERLVLDLDRLFFTDVASARALDSACKALEKQCPSSCGHRPVPVCPDAHAGRLGRVRRHLGGSRRP